MAKAVKIVKRWYNERLPQGGSILIAGGFGCGKTHLAQAIHQIYGFGSVYWDETELFKTIQGTFGNKEASEESIMMRLIRAELLVFDDLGSYETDNLAWIQNIYRRIFDGRCDKGKPVFFTSNLPIVKGDRLPIQDRIGGRNFDRLCGALETKDYYVNLFNVPSYRTRKMFNGKETNV